MAEAKNENEESQRPAPPPKPAESKAANDSQFPRPTMQAIHGSADPPRERMLKLSQNKPRKK